jgi:hypothetical protein
MGFYSECQTQFGDQADFVVMNSNITHLIGMARMGLCLPKGCKQYHYDAFVDSSLKMVNGFLDYLDNYYNHPVLNGTFVRSWTRVGMSLTKTDEYNEDWYARTAGGVVPTCIIIGLIVLVSLTANLIKYY